MKIHFGMEWNGRGLRIQAKIQKIAKIDDFHFKNTQDIWLYITSNIVLFIIILKYVKQILKV